MSFSPLVGSSAPLRDLVAPALPRIVRRPGAKAAVESPAPLIAFCHLGWGGVWQRPQQFLSRLARTRPVLFVEAHCSAVPASCTKTYRSAAHPTVTVLEMHLPSSRWHDGEFIDLERRRLLQTFRATEGDRFDRPVLWFNDPMAVTAFAGHCGEIAIVYDCMDELSQFKGAPAGLAERERELLRVADVVFCGGRKMQEKRLPLNRNTHFYGTGVDYHHFGQARSATLPVHPDIARLPGKVLGYFGVIDERLDYDLLASLADANPHWSVAMVGPTAKVDPADLPRRPNLHWLGARAYQELPAITRGFSVCLMPFALNSATEYINPTKVLEYMAAGRPVVSTALDEVQSNFDSVPRIARSTTDFIQLCREECERADSARVRRGLALAARHTWEAITEAMDAHLRQITAPRAARPRPAMSATGAILDGRLNHV